MQEAALPGTRVLNRLTAAKVKSIKEAGRYEDGGGLRLVVEGDAERGFTKRWVLRISMAGNETSKGLGGYPAVSLEEARTKAAEIRKAARDGIDVRAEARKRAVKGTTFREMFEISFAQRRQQLSNAKHLAQWPSSMEAYVFPHIGDKPVAEVNADDVITLLTPIWFEKPETAKRVLQRIEVVMKSAIVRGIRERASPTVGISAELGTAHRTRVHHPSMPWGDVPGFVAKLKEPNPRRWPTTAPALEFAILTACRSGEVRGALWSEIDIETATWSIPAERMKAREPHRVPLPVRCIEILDHVRALGLPGDLIFRSAKPDKPLSDMTLLKVLRDAELPYVPHGFRSSFRVWASEVAKAQHEVAEAALAHAVPNQVVAAYLRSDFFDDRRTLMAAWADHCGAANCP